MKVVPVVDREDRVIGVKDYPELTDNDIWRASILWVINSNNQILLAQRKLNKVIEPGRWGESVAGTVEVNETYESNIYKEAEEEIGLKGYKFKRISKVFAEKAGMGKRFFTIYKIDVDWPLEKFKPQKSELEAIKWIDKKHFIDDIKKNPGNYTTISKISYKLL